MADLDFAYDLTLDEARRRTAVLEAIGDDWDPIAVLAEENRAYDMLYSDLDEEQQRIYDELVSAGVLPERDGRSCCRLIRPPTVPAAPGWSARAASTAAPCDRLPEQRNCATHWQYLLSNQGTLVHMQCPTCAYLWSTDTRQTRACGSARRPDRLRRGLGPWPVRARQRFTPGGGRSRSSTTRSGGQVDRPRRVAA